MRIVSAFLLIAAVLFVGIGRWLSHFAEKTAADWKMSTGVITSYNVRDYSSYDTPLVQFEDEGKKVLASAASVRSKGRPKEGSVVDIKYRKNVFQNETTYQVIVMSDVVTYGDSDLPPLLMTGIGIALGVLGVVLLFLKHSPV